MTSLQKPSSSNKKTSKWFFTRSPIIILLSLSILGFLLFRIYQFASPQENENDQSSNTWKTYKSDLGFQFAYPLEWGEAKEEIIDADEYKKGWKGKMYNLTFTNSEAYASGRSKDFSAPRGAWLSDYSGDEAKEAGVTSYIDITSPGCFTMGTQNSFQGIVDFNLPGKEISGVRGIVPILSDSDLEKIKDEFNVEPYVGSDECSEDETKANESHRKAQQILKFIERDKNLDNESLRNLDIFYKIADSSTLE